MTVKAEDIANTLGGIVDEKLAVLEKKFEEKSAAKKSELTALAEGSTVNTDSKKIKGAGLAQMARAMGYAAFAKITPEAAAKHLGYASIEKSMSAGSAVDGGFLVPEPVVAEVIELLRDKVVVQAAGARILPMINGNLSMNYSSASGVAAYGSECGPAPLSGAKLGRLKLAAKKLKAMYVVCNDLFKFTGDSSMAEAYIRDDLVQLLATRKDSALLRGDGTGDQPKGMRWLADSANVFDRSLDAGAVTLDTVDSDLQSMITRLETANINMITPAWFFSARTKGALMKLKNALGMPIFAAEMATGKLKGYPFYVTNAIPSNLVDPADVPNASKAVLKSEVIFADMSNIVIGETQDIMIAVSTEAAYIDASGISHSAFQNDDSVIRAIAQHDIADRQRGKSIAVLTKVDWQ